MAKRGSTQAVVIVEDDESMREAIEQLLCVAGFRTVGYESAEALLSAVATENPLCVVSDINLPAMSGLDLLTELGRSVRHLPVIIITAFDSASSRQEAARRGASAYLAKPFASGALLAAIAEIAANKFEGTRSPPCGT
jgi:FixJ family two-component response regulator